MNFIFILSRLWRYLSIYFLKPFDAVNDTLTASLLSRFNWDKDIIEIGSGDGVFSYIMHGGSFPIWFDRYLLADLKQKDIFELHKKGVIKPSKKLHYPNIVIAIDAKNFHIEKVKEIGFAENAICMPYEKLEIENNSVEKIFYYTPHGLKNHKSAISEAYRILKENGTLLILLFNSDVKSSFIANRMSETYNGTKVGEYFKKIDNGRFEEISNLSKSIPEWNEYFENIGFKINKFVCGLSSIAWNVYDIQTRPILKYIIRFFNFFPLYIRTMLKVFWMILWYPFLVIFYFLFSNEFINFDKKNCYVAFQMSKLNTAKVNSKNT